MGIVRNWVLCILAVSAAGLVQAQRVVISEQVDRKQNHTEFGMNRKNFRHFYTGIQFMAGSAVSSNAAILYGRSARTELGMRYKRKYSEVFSGGYDLFVTRDAFYMKQHEDKTVPDNVLHKRERLNFLSGGGGLYQRINFGHRGNHMGQYIDLGFYAAWFLQTRHITLDTAGDMRIKVKSTGLPYTNSWAYGLTGRLGFGSVVIKAGYRLSELFHSDAAMTELPRLTFGLEFGFHPQ